MNSADSAFAQGHSQLEKSKENPARPPRQASLWRDASGDWQYVPSGSAAMQSVEQKALRVAPSQETVLILGETGVGKDLLARLIHHNSTRRDRPFVHLNCASLSEGLLESELFGHMRGAYTGAVENRMGQFEAASGGTLFLDEIGEIPPRLQAKLLHVLQERKLYRVGGRQVVEVDVRVLAATNRDLTRDIKAGTFRQDLYYRLGVVSLRVPPLRERREDLESLALHFLRRYATQYNRPELADPGRDFFTLLGASAWPGNIRELENAIKRMILLGGDAELDASLEDVPCGMAAGAPEPASAAQPALPSPRSLREVARHAVEQAERAAILQSLERHDWNRRRAARELEMSYRSLLYKIKDYTLTRRSTSDPQEDPVEP
ncbi:MAG TPA: sigma-54 dependent transcriptional regulator [Candidatus Polarisedimenticolia bacterium]|nr:sigma-54 dependent transcriptional regulator [Candidatus Polarisedimenticolia bacterium]